MTETKTAGAGTAGGRSRPCPSGTPAAGSAIAVLAVLAAMFVHMLVTNDGVPLGHHGRQHVPPSR